MAEYRWNELDMARGYDQAAEYVHPYYREIQDVILQCLASHEAQRGWIVDLGGGSGRLAERILATWPNSKVCIVDQSRAFLTLAAERLRPFGERSVCLRMRLQDEWASKLPDAPSAIVSMSAIHHLNSAEKEELYAQAARCLVRGGILLNGDEVRPERDEDYLAECRRWADHLQRVMADGLVPECFREGLRAWISRNVDQFGGPRASGDDCHETIDAQLAYCSAAGRPTNVSFGSVTFGLFYSRRRPGSAYLP